MCIGAEDFTAGMHVFAVVDLFWVDEVAVDAGFLFATIWSATFSANFLSKSRWCCSFFFLFAWKGQSGGVPVKFNLFWHLR
jgi:hypothetical protein